MPTKKAKKPERKIAISATTARQAIAALDEKSGRCRAGQWDELAERCGLAAFEIRLALRKRR